MATVSLVYTFRRIIAVILISLMLVAMTLLLMNRSTAAQPLPDVEVPEAAGLVIDMLGPDTVRAGQSVTFTILVTNSTGQTLPNVVVTDSWYLLTYNGNFQVNNLSVVTYSYRPTATQPYIRWDLGTLASGASGSIVMTTDVTVTLQPSTTKNLIGAPTLLANTAAIATSAPGVPSANNGVNPVVIGPVMYLEKTFAPAYQRPGRLVTFTLKLTNRPLSERADSISSTNTIITEIIPARTTLWSVLPGSGVTYDYLDSARVLTYYLANPVQPGQNVYVTFTVRLSPTLKNANDVASVRNNRSGFGFRSTEVTIPRPGDADVVLTGNEIIEKSVQVGPPPPTAGNPPRTFPARIITYTIGVYNPFTETLSGMRLTDTLPQAFASGPYFIYSTTLPVAPFSAPTVISVAGRTVVWDLPDIEAWGVYSFALRVWVPANFDTSTNLNGRAVDNSIYAIRLPNPPVIYDNLIPIEARVVVVPQIIPAKTISPGPVYSGFPETYTLWLTNTGNTTITNIIITDTLPTSQWRFEEMIFGPSPVLTTPQIVWQGLTIPAYSGARLSFRVKAVGSPTAGNYCNTVGGFSPDTFIPTVSNLACMQFLNPFTLNKIAIAPNDYVVLGGGFAYRITIGNVSFQDYGVSQIWDSLPVNFQVLSGGGLYIQDYASPAALPAGGSLSTQFDVIAASVPPDVCNKLPATIYQAGGQVRFTLAEPPQTWYNPGNLAPVMVYPHIGLGNSSELPGAAPGELVTYTLVLSNNTSNAYTNIIVTDTLPAADASNAFEFARMAPGSTVPAPQVNGRVLTWWPLSLAPNSSLQFTFVTTATQLPGDNLENRVIAVDLDNLNTCIPWLGTGYVNARAGVRVNVRLKKMEYYKTVTPISVGPLGLVQYNVVINNRGPYTVTNVVVTDVLPTSVAEPYWQFNSNVTLPPGVTQLSSNPPAWHIAQLNNNGAIAFSFKARASIFPGSNYKNYMNGFAPTWILTQAVNHLGAPVTIVPGAALDKVVSPKTVVAGDRVIYTITLYNQSGAPLTGMRITDTLPTGFIYDGMVSPSAPLPDTAAPLVWGTRLPASLSNGTRLELAFYARISGTLHSGVYYNRVRASARDISIPDTDNTAPVQVFGAPSVAVSKVADRLTAFQGGTLIYTVTLTNEGAQSINVRVTDTLPTGFSFLAPLGTTQPPDLAQPLVWYNIPLGQGETRDLGFVVSVASDAPTGTVYNQVNLSGAGYVFPGTGPTAPVLVKSQPTYDLQVSKDGTPKFVQVGDRITYTIVYANDTDDEITVSNVMLTDTLPSAEVSVIGEDSPCWAELTPVWVCPVGDLAPNQTGVVTLVLQLNTAPPENYLLNQVAIGGTAPANAADDNLANNTASALVYTGIFPEVAIAKDVTPALAFTGDPITYTMVLTNNGSVTVTLRVTDTMPTDFMFDNVVSPTPAPISTAPLVWNNLVLQPGQSIALMWRAVVGADTPPGFYYNAVDLDTFGLPLPGRTDLAQIETDVRRYYAMQISKSDGQSKGTPGSTLNYTIRYTNTSTNVTLTQMVLTDLFSPTGSLTFLNSGWTLAATGVYTQARADLPPGASTAIIVQLQLAPSLPPELLAISNTVVIAAVPALRATELITSNHTATDIDIVAGADLAVTDLRVTPARVRNGGIITAVVTVVNQGLAATLGPNGTGWFGIDLYVKPESGTAPLGPGDRYYGLCPTATNFCPNDARWSLYKAVKEYNGVGLNVDETMVLTYTYVVPDTILPNKGPLWVYAQADMYWGQTGMTEFGTPDHGRILEGDEVNNVSGPVVVYLNANVYLPLIRK
ncbi:hypothetical protein TFLX_05087 [Thermoflexales bacterium]|nr:hypothetical protein TFLX_05087 [Thermoflexales bacterium]